MLKWKDVLWLCSCHRSVKTTGTGKLMKMKAYKSHILNKKSTKRKRNLRKAVEVDATNAKMMKRILPYSK